jgi:hypothetical protein
VPTKPQKMQTRRQQLGSFLLGTVSPTLDIYRSLINFSAHKTLLDMEVTVDPPAQFTPLLPTGNRASAPGSGKFPLKTQRRVSFSI